MSYSPVRGGGNICDFGGGCGRRGVIEQAVSNVQQGSEGATLRKPCAGVAFVKDCASSGKWFAIRVEFEVGCSGAAEKAEDNVAFLRE